MVCKAMWQRSQRPISREELEDLYVRQGLGTYRIAQIVGRDPKRVYEWLQDEGIEIRKRSWSVESGTAPYHDERWLRLEYEERGQSATDIAARFGVSENTILYFLEGHGISRRSVSEARELKQWRLCGPSNGMFGRCGPRNPNWKGGATPERQAVYATPEWKAVVKVVWKRDRAICRRCYRKKTKKDVTFHLHHLVSFSVPETRLDPDNIVLLCKPCHNWVHSRKNAKKKLIHDFK